MFKTEEIITGILDLSLYEFEKDAMRSRLNSLLSDMGFSVAEKYPTFIGRSVLDLYAIDARADFTVGVEINRFMPRFRSVEKLKKVNADLSLILLRSAKFTNRKFWEKARELPPQFAVLSLQESSVILSSFGGSQPPSKMTRRSVQKVVSLGEGGDPNNVAELLLSLSHNDANIRRLACSALGKIGSPAAERPLVGMLFDQKPQVRQYAINALGKVGTAYSLPILKMISNSGKDKEYNIKAAKDATLCISKRAGLGNRV